MLSYFIRYMRNLNCWLSIRESREITRVIRMYPNNCQEIYPKMSTLWCRLRSPKLLEFILWGLLMTKCEKKYGLPSVRDEKPTFRVSILIILQIVESREKKSRLKPGRHIKSIYLSLWQTQKTPGGRRAEWPACFKWFLWGKTRRLTKQCSENFCSCR